MLDMVGDRGVDVRMQVLNPPICLIRPLLPTTPPNGMSIRLTQGATDQANPSGVFHVGDNPVIDILVPASFAGSRLDVFVVSEDGGVLKKRK